MSGWSRSFGRRLAAPAPHRAIRTSAGTAPGRCLSQRKSCKSPLFGRVLIRSRFARLPRPCGQTETTALHRCEPLARGRAIPWGRVGAKPVASPRFSHGAHSVSGACKRVETSGGIRASLAGRYASALFDLARDQRQIESVGNSLDALNQALLDSKDFAELVSSPLVSRDQAGKAFAGLKTQLRARAGREVAIDATVDPTILGGIVVKLGSQQIDASIRTKLNRLAKAMKG